MKKIECIVDSTVSETYNQPEGNDAVTWGFFSFFFFFLFFCSFFWARSSDGFVFLATHLKILMF